MRYDVENALALQPLSGTTVGMLECSMEAPVFSKQLVYVL
jgi:hypothetical protein